MIDRDFGESNRSTWIDPNKTFRRFILPVHEIENYLLDAGALAASRFNNLGKSAVEIEAMMTTAAGRLCWWAACRDVVAELRRRFRQDFIPAPTCPPVDDETQARNHICQSPWFQRLAPEISRTTVADVHQLLADAHSEANRSLTNGGWKVEFAGKEILRDVGSRICDRTKVPGYKPSPAKFDEDLAKEVGAWQRQNHAIPSDLTDLLSALQQRIARARTRP